MKSIAVYCLIQTNEHDHIQSHCFDFRSSESKRLLNRVGQPLWRQKSQRTFYKNHSIEKKNTNQFPMIESIWCTSLMKIDFWSAIKSHSSLSLTNRLWLLHRNWIKFDFCCLDCVRFDDVDYFNLNVGIFLAGLWFLYVNNTCKCFQISIFSMTAISKISHVDLVFAMQFTKQLMIFLSSF